MHAGQIGHVERRDQRFFAAGGNLLEQLALACRQRHARAARHQRTGKFGANSVAGADHPHTPAAIAGKTWIQRPEEPHHCFANEIRTSPTLKPQKRITARFSITRSSIRYIQSSKSIL